MELSLREPSQGSAFLGASRPNYREKRTLSSPPLILESKYHLQKDKDGEHSFIRIAARIGNLRERETARRSAATYITRLMIHLSAAMLQATFQLNWKGRGKRASPRINEPIHFSIRGSEARLFHLSLFFGREKRARGQLLPARNYRADRGNSVKYARVEINAVQNVQKRDSSEYE